jgi:Methylase involved in ubiquinone/menaquinone biosynthesis
MTDEYAFEAELYDKVWGRYDYDTDVKFLDELFKKYRCRKIIDLGCGTGNHAIRLSPLGMKSLQWTSAPPCSQSLRPKSKTKKYKSNMAT